MSFISKSTVLLFLIYFIIINRVSTDSILSSKNKQFSSAFAAIHQISQDSYQVQEGIYELSSPDEFIANKNLEKIVGTSGTTISFSGANVLVSGVLDLENMNIEISSNAGNQQARPIFTISPSGNLTLKVIFKKLSKKHRFHLL